MWRKILKCRDYAKQFYKVEVRNGRRTSFWHENWSTLGCLQDIVGNGGYIDMGIPANAMVEESRKHRRRDHRVVLLNRVELEIERYKRDWTHEEDISLWRNEKGSYKKDFSTKETWRSVREKYQACSWHRGVWFKHATPKFSFITWLAMRGRLSTGDRMRSWNIDADTTCSLCQDPIETLSHLFFDCAYSAKIWEALMKGVLRDQYTTKWEEIVRMISIEANGRKIEVFTMRYMFQAVVHTIWRERNKRRHGEDPSPAEVLIKRLDKNIRNIFTVIQRRGDKEYAKGMEFWFSTR